MQIGSRWAAGAPPHSGVPQSLYPALAAAEREHPSAMSWTLTWLEGRPRCTLDDRVTVFEDANGAIRTDELSDDEAGDDDDWLS